MSSESSDTPDLQTQIELLDSKCNDLDCELTNAMNSLSASAEGINGWSYSGKSTVAGNIMDMSDALIAAIKDRDARIQNLQLKLGQLVERGP